MNRCLNCPIVKCTIFSGVEPCVLDCLGKEKTAQFYKKKSILFSEGEIVQGIHCVYDGKIKVYQKDKRGKKHILAVCQGGDALGLVTLFTENKYRVTAEAMEDSRVCLLNKNAVLPALKQSTTFLQNILKELASNVNRLTTTLGEQRQASVRERIAKTLLSLSETRVPGDDKIKNKSLRVSRTDIANFSGTVLESAVRCLSEFKKEGFIQISGKEIQIIRPDLLKKLAAYSR